MIEITNELLNSVDENISNLLIYKPRRERIKKEMSEFLEELK